MKLNGIHLFGILFLSLLLGSVLGKILGGNGMKEGNTSMTMNQHTGGEQSDISKVPLEPFSDKPESKLNAATGNSSSEDSSEPFTSLFDSILPSNVGTLEPFIFPSLEGLANESDASKGITKDQIPPGQEHLYVLKSQVVPPSCPVNPGFNQKNSEYPDGEEDEHGDGGAEGAFDQDGSSGLSNGLGAAFNGSSSSKNKKCPPCPACARCPEPSFECKKVPNYSVSSNGSMSVPRPVLADFAQFGM
jgi:hypothetical protein